MGGDAMTAISSFSSRPRLARVGVWAMAIAVVVTIPDVFAATTTASAAPASNVASLPSVALAPSVAPIDDPIADSAQTALDLALRDVDAGGVASTTYLVARALVADQVGARLWTPGRLFDEAWGRADMEHQVALLSALSQLGVPYRRYASNPGVGFDCSGLTSYAWSAAGFTLPRSSTAQIRMAEPRTIDTAQAGDILRYPGHVMMWLGVGQAIIHAPFPGRHVEIKFLANRSMKRSKFGDPTE